jgi:threonine dehydratase
LYIRIVAAAREGSSHRLLPSSDSLDAVRDLGARFPEARLRKAAVVRATELDRRADPTGATRVWLAIESLQVTGSFKVRGALVALDAMPEGVTAIAASAGNHGAGVAYAARVLGKTARIVVPQSTPTVKREKIAKYGAELVVAPSPHYDDAEALARALAEAQPDRTRFISPYDDVDVIAGNGASLGFEIVGALGGVPEVTLVPFGGGGLATGIAVAFAAEAQEQLGTVRRVWGVQSEASPAMADSLEKNAAVERLEGGETLAEGLEGGISVDGFERARGAIAGIVVVPEGAIAEAMAFAYASLGLVLEGSAAVALTPVLGGLPPELRGGDTLVVLTGRNLDVSRLTGALAGIDP